VPKRLGGVRPALRAAAANSVAAPLRPSPRTSVESSWAIVTGAVDAVVAVGRSETRPETSAVSAPRVSGSFGWKVWMLLAIRPCETTTLICGCAQETGCAPPWFWAAAGAASTAKTAVVARMRLIRLFVSSGPTSAFSLRRMDFIARPEPDPEAREALSLALGRLLAGDEPPPAYRSRWRAEGITENLDGEDEAPARRRTTHA